MPNTGRLLPAGADFLVVQSFSEHRHRTSSTYSRHSCSSMPTRGSCFIRAKPLLNRELNGACESSQNGLAKNIDKPVFARVESHTPSFREYRYDLPRVVIPPVRNRSTQLPLGRGSSTVTPLDVIRPPAVLISPGCEPNPLEGDGMSSRFHRRQFFAKAAALAAATAGTQFFPVPNILAAPSPNSRLNIAGIGVGGRGGAPRQAFSNENLVAVCDVVEGAREGCLRQIERFNKDHGLSRPLPKSFSDYREMFDKMHGQIDAVFVATPDHHHAVASMTAIRLGKHVYCEKPLTHNIREARLLTLAAREHKVATQMGNNGREGEGWRRLCEWIWAGAIGDVQEAHIWTDRAGIPSHFWWPQGGKGRRAPIRRQPV